MNKKQDNWRVSFDDRKSRVSSDIVAQHHKSDDQPS